MVAVASNVVVFYENNGSISEECASCIMNQFGRNIPIAQQKPCIGNFKSDAGVHISKISPRKVANGYTITIEGINFLNDQGQVVFSCKGIEETADITEWTDTKIVATVPSGLKRGINKVSVFTIEGNESNLVTVRVKASQKTVKK